LHVLSRGKVDCGATQEEPKRRSWTNDDERDANREHEGPIKVPCPSENEPASYEEEAKHRVEDTEKEQHVEFHGLPPRRIG
jgi:hypothetical protein